MTGEIVGESVQEWQVLAGFEALFLPHSPPGTDLKQGFRSGPELRSLQHNH